MDRRRREPQREGWATGLCPTQANHAYGSVRRPAEVTEPDFPAVTRVTPEQLDILRRFAALGPAITADRSTDSASGTEATDAPR